ncbi:MAG TPA: HAD family hydrolase [Rhodocyclaceae bacterium]|nr:HAD family hydrolase [Rhodocyclaceae bacterium]
MALKKFSVPLHPTVHTQAIFLDKDGTLLVDAPYNVEPTNMVLADGAAQALALLGDLGAPLAVISNQAGVALGKFSEKQLGAVHDRLAELFKECGAKLAGFYYCPHHPDGSVPRYAMACDCRKPAPGLLWRAAEDLGVGMENCWMVGDILDDVEAGRRAGCNTILIDNGNETEWFVNDLRRPRHVVRNMHEAAALIAQSIGRNVMRPMRVSSCHRG